MKFLQQLMEEYDVFAPAEEEMRSARSEQDSALYLTSPAPGEGQDGEVSPEAIAPQAEDEGLMDLPDGTEKYEAYLKKKGILDANGKPIPPPEDGEAEEKICDCDGDCAACANDPALTEIEPEAELGPIEPQGELEPAASELPPEEEEDEIEFNFSK